MAGDYGDLGDSVVATRPVMGTWCVYNGLPCLYIGPDPHTDGLLALVVLSSGSHKVVTYEELEAA